MAKKKAAKPKSKPNDKIDSEETTKICGIVMPISATPHCPETHWEDVRRILDEVISASGFSPRMVSDGNDIGFIHKRIVNNLFDNPIIVCDVSERNPNVMFEMGMRLTFDKPIIIIKDDKTPYSFDTSPIEHISYPRDLRYPEVRRFRRKLGKAIKDTYAEWEKDPKKYTQFLKHFKQITPSKLESEELPQGEMLMRKIDEMAKSIDALKGNNRSKKLGPPNVRVLRYMDSSGESHSVVMSQKILERARQIYAVEKKSDQNANAESLAIQTIHILSKEIPNLTTKVKNGLKWYLQHCDLSSLFK